MIDLPVSGRCAHDSCTRRRVRAGLCVDHWGELWGDGYGPWPEDVEPASWRDKYLKRTGTPYVRARDREQATA